MLLLCAGSIFLGGTRWIKREREKKKERIYQHKKIEAIKSEIVKVIRSEAKLRRLYLLG